MAALRYLLEQDRRQRVLTGNSAMLDPLQVLSDEDSVRYFTQAVKEHPQAQCKIPLEVVEAIPEYRPEEAAHSISPRALLLIAVEHDVPCPKEEYEAMYAKAREPKKLVVLPGFRHYDVYSGEGLDTTSRLAIDWFQQYLAG